MMQEQQLEEEDIHICGLCKTSFSDVDVFLHHKTFSCPVRLSRQQKEAQKLVDTNKEVVSSSSDNNVVEFTGRQLIEHNEPLVSNSNHIELTSTDQHLIRPVLLTVNKNCLTLESDLNNQHAGRADGANIQIPFEGQHQYTHAISEGHTECISNNIQHRNATHEYVLLSNGQGTEQYGSQGNQSEGENSHSAYTLTSHDTQLADHTAPLISQPLLQQVSENVYLKGLIQEATTSQANQLPVFISREITQNDGIIQTGSTEENMPIQIQERTMNNSDTDQSIQYTVTFDSQALNQPVSTSSTSGVTENPKMSFDTHTKQVNEARGKTHQLKTDLNSKPETSLDNKKGKRILEKKYTCSTCHYKTAYLKDLERHSRIHTGEKPFKCTHCVKAFNRSDKLTLHLKYHQNDRSYKCELCDYRAVEKSSLKKHMKVHLDQRPYECQICPYKSRSSSQLQIHLRVHTGDTPYRCKECGAFFKVNSDLKRHQRVHTGEKPFHCTEPGCSYKCAIKSNLRSHMKTNHRSDVQFTCETCNFQSSSKKAFFEHKKVHEVISDLMCSICNYQCSNRSALRNHKKMHNEERFQCNYCSYTSHQSGNVQAHMKRKHNSRLVKIRRVKVDSNETKKQEGGIFTDSAKGSNRSNLSTKCKQNFTCDQCDAAFVREDSLRCHLKQHSDSSLSTAYAVLKLQNPVINPSPNVTQTGSVSSQPAISQSENQSRISHSETMNQNLLTVRDSSQIILHHDQGIQNQAANLGINDILAAARLSGLTSCGNSPTFKKPLDQFIFQEGSDGSSTLTTVTPSIENTEDQTITISQQQDMSTVQVMQNVSLPYMRLPNGQILILTGQNSSSPVVHQSNTVTQDEMSAIQTQIIAQQPTTEQQQIIQIPENSTPNSVSSISSPQSGAIPIQIILPNDSQQAIPLVSQLLNSVLNRGASEGVGGGILGQPTAVGPTNTKESVNEGIQNFVVQIPAQSGTLKDPSGSITEGQSFVLQIPGTGNVC